jgi:regulatory protein
VTQALYAAGVKPADAPPPPDAASALAAAITFARRRRLGPFARVAADDAASRRKQLAAMLRAGHDMVLARAVLGAADEAVLDALLAEEAE